MAPPTHRPRKKRVNGEAVAAVSNDSIISDPVTKIQKPAFPLVAFLLPARGTVSQWVVLPLILMVVGLFRWTTGFWNYSGK